MSSYLVVFTLIYSKISNYSYVLILHIAINIRTSNVKYMFRKDSQPLSSCITGRPDNYVYPVMKLHGCSLSEFVLMMDRVYSGRPYIKVGLN